MMLPEVKDCVLSMSDIAFSYGRADILKGVNLQLFAGEIGILIGRNGAGKSTLLRCAAGWSLPREGRVELLGQPLREANRELRKEIVLITDTPPFYDDLSALEHVQFVLRANRAEERLSEAERLLDAFGLTDSAGAFPSAFSRGMRYKLALTIALAVRPQLLLLDEPFGPIDPVSVCELWRELKLFSSSGGSVLVSTHQLPEGGLPDRYFVLDGGVIADEGAWVDFGLDGAVTIDALLRSAIESTKSIGNRDRDILDGSLCAESIDA